MNMYKYFFNWAYNHKIMNTELKTVGKVKVKKKGQLNCSLVCIFEVWLKK